MVSDRPISIPIPIMISIPIPIPIPIPILIPFSIPIPIIPSKNVMAFKNNRRVISSNLNVSNLNSSNSVFEVYV